MVMNETVIVDCNNILAEGQQPATGAVTGWSDSFAKLTDMSISEDAPRVTLSEVAETAGVSLATVSKVLNGRSDVSSATRAKVEVLLAQHGYLRRNSGQSRTQLLEVVFHELESAWAMEIIRGVKDVAAEHGMSVVLTESGSRHAPGPEWIESVMRRRPVGVVLVFSDLPPEYR